MKRVYVLTLMGAALAGLSAINPCRAEVIYQYCMIGSPSMATDCLYSTIQQCQMSASAGTGFCTENPRYTVYVRQGAAKGARRQ
jgi:hypothetical protein